MYYEIATLPLNFGTGAQAALAVQSFVNDDSAVGELLGCWMADIGALNQMLVLRGFDDLSALHAERMRCLHSADPFQCSAYLAGPVCYDSYEGFAWQDPVRPSSESGIQGPVYEIRTYGIRPGGLQPTIDLWREYVPARQQISPCVVAMVAIDGVPRFTNIWAYASTDARAKARTLAVDQGIWPPRGGPAWLTTDMRSVIALPAAISPLQ